MSRLHTALAIGALVAASPAASVIADDAGPGGRVLEVTHNPPGDEPILGPRHAPVTIEFFLDIRDYNRSLNVHRNLAKLAARHPTRLRVIYRVTHSRSPVSSKAYEAALEAFTQGRFHQFLDAFYGTHRRGDSDLKKIAEKAGVDVKRIEAAWADERHRETVVANHYRMRRFGLGAAPAVLINGEPIPSPPRNLDDFEERYDTAYDAAKIRIAEGVPVSQLYARLLVERLADTDVPRIRIGAVDGERLPKETLARDNGFALKGPVDYTGPYSQGPKDASAVVVLYCSAVSRNCPRMIRHLTELAATYPRDLRVIIKPVSLTEEGEKRERIMEIHAASECAGAQGAFWSYFGRVVSRGRTVRDLDQYLTSQAERAAVNVERWKRCRASSKTRQKLAARRTEALTAGVERTPSLVIGGRIYLGRISDRELAQLVELELAPGLLESWLD